MSRKHETKNPNPRNLKVISPSSGGSLIAQRIGRNSPCGCGSGKKAKACCGAATHYGTTQGHLLAAKAGSMKGRS